MPGADHQAGYALLDHTADVGVEAWGPDPGRAFAEAARGLFVVLLDADPADVAAGGRTATITVAVEGVDWPALLVNWLAELLFHFDVDLFVPRTIQVEECDPPRCRATLQGLCLDSSAAAVGVSVKAITYHQLRVDVQPGRTEVRVILDI